MVGRVLGLAELPVRAIMTPAAAVTWLEVDEEAKVLSRRILRAGHAAYPVCRGGLGDLLGVGRTPDLICDLLQNGRISIDTLEGKPLTFPGDASVLEVVEKLRGATVPMAIVNDGDRTIKGVVTSTDLLETILGKGKKNS